jgi:signal transduction histidine kinase
MFRRLALLTVTILFGLGTLTCLGYHALGKWQEGMEGIRLGEYARVAEHIQQELKKKIDGFLEAEQKRPYTDYLYYHVPEQTMAQQEGQVLLRSPLGGQVEHGLAYGHFQMESNGRITTPNDEIMQREGPSISNRGVDRQNQEVRDNVDMNLKSVLNPRKDTLPQVHKPKSPGMQQVAQSALPQAQAPAGRNQSLTIDSFQNQQAPAQNYSQKRMVFNNNIASNAWMSPQPQTATKGRGSTAPPPQPAPQAIESQFPSPSDEVQIRVEPFAPKLIPNPNDTTTLFGGQVFMVRHVQVDTRHLMQGFQVDEQQLTEQIEATAKQAVLARQGLEYVLARVPRDDTAHAAILDFGFGDIVLNLFETNPNWITQKVNWLQRWYLGSVLVILCAVGLGLVSLWRGTAQQLQLAQKKDDFISAVSHELRTPLTSIRMYAELLEKGWVKTPEKRQRYYRNVHQESERLGRLIDNVLDFARIQRGKKRYAFSLGDLNICVADTVEMIRPYAEQQQFHIQTELAPHEPFVFDRDAVTQIVINLIDNAIKYARDAQDKHVTVRTRHADAHSTIEVEDRGPGIPRKQHKKVFEAFFRTEAEATRSTTGTGLGLALVKRFAQAHQGDVHIASAQPKGALLRVVLSHSLEIPSA